MMKTKSIILSTLLGVVLFGVSSCEKMLTTDSTITMKEQDHTWDSSDTVYSVMGMIAKMQKLADRTVLLGELRGDLVQLNENADEALNQISNFDFTTDNEYNKPVDYYALINNCNYYLANVDTTFDKNGVKIFANEYPVVLAYRAWAYLKLAEAYGQVYFVTDPIIDGAKADTSLYEKLDIRQIADRLIPDLLPYQGKNMLPNWGTVSESFKSQNLFIPNDLILADLLLWAGRSREDYILASKLLLNYLFNDATYKTVGISRVWWKSHQFLSYDNQYSSSVSFGTDKDQVITYIPMHKDEFDGITSKLPEIFCSTDKNFNRYQATSSEALLDIAAKQDFCYAYVNTTLQKVEPYLLSHDDKASKLEKGDLRVAVALEKSKETDLEKITMAYSSNKQNLVKINREMICIYRTDQVYLRLAEALNCAGFPELAFTILKYGLCYENLNYYPTTGKPVPYTSYISDEEFYEAIELFDIYTLTALAAQFIPLEYNLRTGEFKNTSSNTFGIHSKGCGDSRYNDSYVLTKIDTTTEDFRSKTDEEKLELLANNKKQQQAEVADYLIDELALETCFEGYRFGDLVRFSMHRGDEMGIYTDNEFLATKVAARNQLLYDKLVGSNAQGYNPNWYLPLN